MRQMLDRVHAQVKQFSGLAAEPACKHDAHGGQFATGDSGKPEKGAQARGYLAIARRANAARRAHAGANQATTKFFLTYSEHASALKCHHSIPKQPWEYRRQSRNVGNQ